MGKEDNVDMEVNVDDEEMPNAVSILSKVWTY